MMVRSAAVWLFRLAAYLAFQASFIALILAATGLGGVVSSLDGSPSASPAVACAVDLGLILLFGAQHTIMARPSFKRLVPASIERSMFVFASSACVAALALGWSPIEGDVWRFHGALAVGVRVLALAGFAFAGWSTFAFDHLELFGLRPPRAAQFGVPVPYRVVRHPMMLGMLVGFWATPRMTVGHLLFAAGLTAYILIDVRFEERSLVRTFGEDYLRYRSAVPSLLPWPRPGKAVRERAPE